MQDTFNAFASCQCTRLHAAFNELEAVEACFLSGFFELLNVACFHDVRPDLRTVQLVSGVYVRALSLF